MTGSWVRQLRPRAGDGPEPACPAEVVDEAVRELGAAPVAWASETAAELTRQVVQLMPEFDTGPAGAVALQAGIEAAVLGVLRCVTAGRVVEDAVTPEAAQTAQEFVRRRISLTSVWGSVRRAHGRLADALMRECVALVDEPERTAALTELNEVTFAFVDRLTETLGDVYTVEHERWLASTLAMREEAVQALLNETDVDVAKASERLRYEVGRRYHLAVLAWPAMPGAADSMTLQHQACVWLTAAGAQQTLLVPQGGGLVWAWGNRRTPFAPDAARTPPADPRVRLVVGSPGHGAEGFRTGHQDAVEAARVVRLSPRLSAPVVDFAAVELLTLLTADRAAAARFVERHLGELANDDPHTADLRTTVRTHLESHSPQTTASRLYVARNTVSYRLKRAEELLGRPLQERQLELWVALTLADAFGQA